MNLQTAQAIKTQLDRQLTKLKLGNQNALLISRSANKYEYKHYVKAYLWWYAAKQVDGYLDSLYSQNGIAKRRVRSGINFRPLLNLLSNGQISDNDLTLWTKALNKVHTEYESKSSHYKTDTVNRLVYFIDNNGGKTGLAEYHTKKGDLDEVQDDASDAEEIRALLFQLDEAEFEPTLIKAAKDYYSGLDNQFSIPSVQTTADGFSVMVVKQDGQYSNLIGSCDNAEMIDKIIAATYRTDFTALPISLRSVLEPLHILNVPTTASAQIEKFIELSRVEDANNQGQKHRAYKRLIYRRETKDFLLSNMWLNASPVLIAKPKSQLFGVLEADIGISNDLRRSIEVRLLHQAMFNLFLPEDSQQYLPAPAGYFSRYKLELNTKLNIPDKDGITASQIVGVTENIRHPDITWRGFFDSNECPQVGLKNKVKSRCVWFGYLELDEIRTVANKFFKPWVNAYSKIANRPVNKKLILRFDQIGLEIEYEIGKDGVGEKFQIAMNNCNGTVAINVRSVDFAFILRQIADLNINGKVEFAANKHGVILSFATDVNDYQCAIPSCNDRFERDDELFFQYDPTKSKLKTTPTELGEFESEYTSHEDEAKELEELISAVKRLGKK